MTGFISPLDKKGLLRRVTLFSQLSDRELERLLEITVTRRLAPREILVRKGEEANQLYAVMRGRFRVATSADDGKEVLLRYIDPGEVVGEIAMFDGEPRSATMTAVESSEVLVVQRRDFFPFLARHPAVNQKLLAAMARHVRSLTESLEDTMLLGLETRLARRLLALLKQYGKQVEGGMMIDATLRQGELGEMVGKTRESVNKQIRTWTKEGLLTMAGGYITVHDVEALQRLGDGI